MSCVLACSSRTSMASSGTIGEEAWGLSTVIFISSSEEAPAGMSAAGAHSPVPCQWYGNRTREKIVAIPVRRLPHRRCTNALTNHSERTVARRTDREGFCVTIARHLVGGPARHQAAGGAD